jgi:hypothetical protein
MAINTTKKISPQFRAHLAHLTPDDKVRAIVLLHLPIQQTSQRTSRLQRQEILKNLRTSTKGAIDEIDHILAHFGGHRLSDEIDFLGGIVVDTPVAGIQPLSESKYVKVILENQPVSLVR